jgi:hypothetical protein
MDQETRTLIEELQRKLAELNGAECGQRPAAGPAIVAIIFGCIPVSLIIIFIFVLIKTHTDRAWKAARCNRNCQCGGESLQTNSHVLTDTSNPRDENVPKSPSPRSVASSFRPPPYGSSSRQAEDQRRLLDDDPLSKV